MVKIIHRVWLNGAIPKELYELHKAMEEMNDDFVFLLWNEKSVQKLCQPHQYEHSTYAGASNLVRLYALKKFGGIYMDMDFKPIAPLSSCKELIDSTSFVARQPDKVLCNACFGALPNHPWINAMIDNYGDQRVKDASWGCHIMEPTITPDVTILPSDTFYPYNWDEDPKPPTENTLAVHLWNGSWIDEKRIH